jgi:hypothetical protein
VASLHSINKISEAINNACENITDGLKALTAGWPGFSIRLGKFQARSSIIAGFGCVKHCLKYRNDCFFFERIMGRF